MKKLIIIRHGKAEEPSFSLRDYDRNLVERGREDARRIAKDVRQALDDQIFQENEKPSRTLLISSSANRAIQTAEIMAEEWGISPKSIQQEVQIYEAYHVDILQVINRIAEAIDTVIVVGHNPGLSMLVNYLTDQHCELKTANAAYLELDESLSFAELSGQTASLKQIFD